MFTCKSFFFSYFFFLVCHSVSFDCYRYFLYRLVTYISINIHGMFQARSLRALSIPLSALQLYHRDESFHTSSSRISFIQLGSLYASAPHPCFFPPVSTVSNISLQTVPKELTQPERENFLSSKRLAKKPGTRFFEFHPPGDAPLFIKAR